MAKRSLLSSSGSKSSLEGGLSKVSNGGSEENESSSSDDGNLLQF